MQTYTFHTDPGHAWLQVPLAELVRLGIERHITRYSFIDGEFAYLEEDCDYATWATAKAARGEAYTWVDVHADPTPVRNYPRYSVAHVTAWQSRDLRGYSGRLTPAQVRCFHNRVASEGLGVVCLDCGREIARQQERRA